MMIFANNGTESSYHEITQLILYDNRLYSNNNNNQNNNINNNFANSYIGGIVVSGSGGITGTSSSVYNNSNTTEDAFIVIDGGGNETQTTTAEPDFVEYLESLSNEKIGLLAFLFLFSFATVFGNSLVILSVIRERSLHTQTNYFITSLAVADCFVGLCIMPFSALYEVFLNTWFFGEDWCDIWRSLDVLFSTASILNLCVISLDRYWAITDPFSYPMRMTRARSAFLIACVWIASSTISFPAISFWRAQREGRMPAFKCTFTEDLGYLVFSSTISFYLPLLVMVFTYCRIYRAAVIQTRSLKLGTKQVLMSGTGELQLTLRIHRGGTVKEPAHVAATTTATSTPEDPDEEQPLSALQNNGLQRQRHMGKNFSLSRKLAKFAKEKKAAKTLGCVMVSVMMFFNHPTLCTNSLRLSPSCCQTHAVDDKS